MNKPEGMSQPKKTKQDLLTELNTVLSVRAEKIRQRLQDEKQMIEDGAYNTTDVVTGIQNLKENVSTPLDNTVTITPEDQRSCLVAKTSQIPVSKARQRRQQKRKEYSVEIPDMKTAKTGGQKKVKPLGTTVKIKNYRPGYNWNIGGRAKELKIRCLARKFLSLWCKKIFGRVRPSVAVNHYKKRLIQSAFTEWYNYWWAIVKEWRLGIRADCHYRYKLWLHIFTRWKEFIKSRRESHTKIKLAYTFYSQHLALSAWHKWRHFISYRREIKMMIKKADNFRANCLISNCWYVWKAQQKAVHVREAKMTEATQFWSHKLQMQHWFIWKSALEERQNLHKKFVGATQHHNSFLVTKCLKNWLLYVKHRRTKKQSAEFATRVYHISVMKRCFNHMHQQWVQIRSMRQHHLQIELHSVRFQRRWVLWRWRQYVDFVKEKKALENLALNFYHNYLQKTCLQVLRLNVVHCRIKVMRNHLAKHLRDTQIQRKYWNCWKTTFEAKEELKIAPETELARKHYDAKILSKGFYSLVNYTQWRKYRKKQYAQADAHYFLQAMPKYLYHMQLFVEKEKTYRSNSLKSIAFQRYTLQQNFFQKWLRAEKESRDERMMDRMAFLHRENIIVQSSFTLWRQRTQQSLLEAKKLSEVKAFYIQSLMYKTWTAWRTVVMDKKRYILNDKKATEHHRVKTFKKSFNQWKKWCSEKKSKKLKLRKAANHHKLKTYRKCISVWKSLVAQGRVFKSLAENKYQQHSMKTLRKTFYEWRTVTMYLSVRKKKVQMIKRLQQRNIVVKIFHEWHKYASTNALKKSQAQLLLSESQIFLQQIKLKLYFKHWVQASSMSSNLHKKYQLAADFNNKKCLSKVMKSWKDYCRLCLKQKLLSRQCSWFHNVRVTAKHYFIWKHRFSELMEEQQQSQVALWQWSLVLQRKVLIAWKEQVEESKHKRCRLATAAALWRENLLKQACSQWLATSDSLIQMRSSMAAQHQAKTIFYSFHIVHKCALHWKIWTKRRKLARGSTKEKSVGATSDRALDKNSRVLSEKDAKYSLPPTTTEIKLFQPQLTAISPSKPLRINGYFPAHSSKRPQPKRPDFLVNSLKRAGLNNFVYDCDAENQGMLDNNKQLKVLESQNKIHEALVKCDELDKRSYRNISKHQLNQVGTDMNLLPPPNTFQPVESHQISFCPSENFHEPHRIPSTSSARLLNGETHFMDMKADCSFELTDARFIELTSSSGVRPQVFPSASAASRTLLEQPSLMDCKYSQSSAQHLTQPMISVAENNFILLKPEDFMRKPFLGDRQPVTLGTEFYSSQLVADLKPFHESKAGNVHYEHFNPRHISNIETASVYVDSRYVSPAPCDPSSKRLLLEREIINIRDKLKHFKNQKKKLSSLQKQYKQLSEWLNEQETQDDGDTIEASKELKMMQHEIAQLECEVDSLKPVCEQLVQRAHVLIRTLELT